MFCFYLCLHASSVSCFTTIPPSYPRSPPGPGCCRCSRWSSSPTLRVTPASDPTARVTQPRSARRSEVRKESLSTFSQESLKVLPEGAAPTTSVSAACSQLAVERKLSRTGHSLLWIWSQTPALPVPVMSRCALLTPRSVD